MLQHSHSHPEIPEEFKRTMLALDDRIWKLHPKNRDRAKGILQNIRRYNRVTEPQFKEVHRLLKLTDRPYKERPKKFYGYRDGATWVSAKEREREHNQKLAHERRYENDPDYRAKCDREAERSKDVTEVFMNHIGKTEAQVDREYVLVGIKHYWPADHLPAALPGIIQPHLKPRRELISCLIRRLRMLRAEGLPTGIHRPSERAEAKHRIRCARVALIAEGIALLRERQTIRNLQNDEAA